MGLGTDFGLIMLPGRCRKLRSLHNITLTALLLAPLVQPAHADLVAHFRFDGDLKDATGQHDGRPVDPKLAPSFAPGRVGNVVVIEKINAGIELANPSAIDFSRDFTIATWVNVGNYFAEMPVLFKGRPGKTTAPDKFFGLLSVPPRPDKRFFPPKISLPLCR